MLQSEVTGRKEDVCVEAFRREESVWPKDTHGFYTSSSLDINIDQPLWIHIIHDVVYSSLL